MITHGNKQISEIVYARKASEGGGAVRLTNIIRGAQVVFGGLKPSPSSWGRLDAPTVAAILTAFGVVDGNAVIKATNAYLNALAATDPTKASALSGFINEDPMLVCSLGLQPQGVAMPIRWLQVTANTGMPYIDTLVVGSLDLEAELNVLYHIGSGTAVIDAINTKSTEKGRIAISHYSQGPNFAVRFGNYGWGNLGRIYSDTRYHILLNKSIFVKNDASYNINASSYSAISNITLANNEFGEASPNSYIRYMDVYIRKSGVSVREFLPFRLSNNWSSDKVSIGVAQPVGTLGMIDTITGTFYPNANTSGSFSIEYTLPDGTPWTPLNHTP